MDTRADQALAEAIRCGDEQAARLFDERFRQIIEAIAHKRGVPDQDCADVAQDILVDAFRHVREGKLRGEAPLATWIYPRSKGGFANYFRKQPDDQPMRIDDVS